MKLVRFEHEGRVSLGAALESGRIVDLAAAGIAQAKDGDLTAVIRDQETALPAIRERLDALGADAGLSADTVRLLAPIPRPPKNVLCVGRNYKEHVEEGYIARGAPVRLPEYPQFFTKPPTAIIGPNDPVRWDPAATQKLDYEVELAVIIGRAGTSISRKDALGHVFGYTVINDVTARDLQRRHDQWFKGKALDTFCPMGPAVVHASALPDPQRLTITMRVNGDVRQSSHTSLMLFDVPTIIEQLSLGMTLEPGDIIATGTPSGVGYAMNPPTFLKAGDVMEAEVEGIGILRNAVEEVSRG